MAEYEQELIDTYIQESRDHLASIEEDLLELERQGESRGDDLINKIFRAAHSIKGGAGFFDFNVIKELAHRLESILDMIRSRKMIPNPEIVTLLLRGFDRLSGLVEESESSEGADISEELVALIGLCSEYSPTSKGRPAVAKFSAPGSSLELESDEDAMARALARGASIFLLRFDLVHDVHRQGKTPLDVIHSLLRGGEIMDSAIDLRSAGTLDDDNSGNDVPFYVLYASGDGAQEIAQQHDLPQSGVIPLRAAFPPQAEPEKVALPSEATPSSVQVPSAGEGESVRVSVGVLDDLMNLSGELVLVRNELSDATLHSSPAAIKAAVQRMNTVTVGIQDAVMRSRMQPASNLFARYQRTVRDLARDMGKEIDIRISGRDTELDRSLIETLSDPLSHLVRNACDHGIEAAEARARSGKARRGFISLSAAHEAGQVVIEVEDDGKGIDADKVAAKAVAMGFTTAERAARMTQKEKLYLVTLPGLSTAASVSDLSGRGVGMDVVKSNVDRLGGRIDIDSRFGSGTKVRITLPLTLPLTLSIIPALIAGIGDERFALPQAAAAELIHVRAGDAQRRIERMGDRPVLVLRGEVLPLVRLADAIGMERLFENPETGCLEPDKRAKIEDRRSPGAEAARKAAGGKDRAKERGQEDRRFHSASDFRIIVVRASGFRYGVIVDRLYDTTEIVVKPLGRHLKALKEYSGATILGDGAVALIIDPAGLALKAGLTTAGEDRVVAEEKVVDDARGWLLFRNGAVEQCAVPLESVERVVKLRQDDLDAIGEDLFLRLGELSLPVFSVSSFTGLTKLGPERAEACVLCHVAGLRFGFLASPPVDSVSADTALDTRSMRRAGVAGTAVIQGRTTVVIDPAGALAALRPQWFDAAAEGQTRATTPKSRPPGAGQSGSRPLVVVAEDSDFFRHLISEILTDSGYEVRETRDGQEALELIHELAGEVRLVLTDVEMPRLDGQGLCAKLKAEYPDLPVVALSSLASEVDEKALRAAGASDYLVKLDRDALLASVASLMDRVGDERLEKETR